MWQMTHSTSRLRCRHRRRFVRSVSPIRYTTKLHPYNTNVISQLHDLVREAKLKYANWYLHGFNFKLVDTWILVILVFLCHSTKCQYMTLSLVCGVLWEQLGLMFHFLRTLIHTDVTFWRHSLNTSPITSNHAFSQQDSASRNNGNDSKV